MRAQALPRAAPLISWPTAAPGLRCAAQQTQPPLPVPPLSSDPQGTLSDYKNELLFSQFGLNYSTLPERFRKASAAPGAAGLAGAGLTCGSDLSCAGRQA